MYENIHPQLQNFPQARGVQSLPTPTPLDALRLDTRAYYDFNPSYALENVWLQATYLDWLFSLTRVHNGRDYLYPRYSCERELTDVILWKDKTVYSSPSSDYMFYTLLYCRHVYYQIMMHSGIKPGCLFIASILLSLLTSLVSYIFVYSKFELKQNHLLLFLNAINGYIHN